MVFYVDMTGVYPGKGVDFFPYTQSEMNAARVMRVESTVTSKRDMVKRIEKLKRRTGKAVHCGREDDFLEGRLFSPKDLVELQDLWAFSLLHNEFKKEEVCELLEKTKAQQGGYAYLIKTPRVSKEKLKLFGGYTGYLEVLTPDYPYSKRVVRLEKKDKGNGEALVYYGLFRKSEYRYILGSSVNETA